MTAEAAARGRSNRNRGARAEVQVVNYLRDQGWPDTRRYLAGDGRQPGDLDWHPLVCLEVKDVTNTAWPSWARQADRQAGAGMIPAVVRRSRGVPDVGAWKCRVGSPQTLELVGRFVPIPGLPELWVETSFAAFVAAVRRIDQDGVA